MKKKQTAEWILQKLSKTNFENFQIFKDTSNSGSPSSSITLAIKNHPIEFTCSLDKSYIRMLGEVGFKSMLLKIDRTISGLPSIELSSEKLISVHMHEVEKARQPSDIQRHFKNTIINQLSQESIESPAFDHSSNGLIIRSLNTELYLILQRTKNNGVWKQIVKGTALLPKPLSRKEFESLSKSFEVYISKHDSFLKKAARSGTFVDINGFELLEDPVQAIHSKVQSGMQEKVKKNSLEKVFNSMIAERPFHEMYERNEGRKVTILCAPTNSGKTYHGIQMIKEALRESEKGNCQMLFPLRVLALQVQQDIEEEGIPCSMITGEEQDIREHSRLDAMTVEIFDTDKEYDTVFLDEGQLSFGEERSSGYLRVLCGARCKHLIIACAPAALNQMTWYLGNVLKEKYEIKYLERLTPLQAINEVVDYSQVRNGDLVVAFSRKSIHEIAKRLSEQGLNVGTMYGALSPAARKAMLNQYRSNSYDVLVATDSIGMGVSAPAQRVLFAETEKFDGRDTRELHCEEYRQIAGRAGRFGYAEFGEAGVLTGNKPDKLIDVLGSDPELLNIPSKLYVLPDKSQLMAAEGIGLKKALEVWGKAIKSNPLYAVSKDVFDELFLKAEWLDKKVFEGLISYPEAVRLIFVTFPMKGRVSKFQIYKEWISKAARDKLVSPPVIQVKDELRKLEDLSIEITLMIQLSRIFPDNFPNSEMLNSQQNQLGEFIAKQLEKKYTHQ